MASSIQFTGMASGIDTAKVVDALMDVEGISKTLLENKISDKEQVTTALQTLNTAVQSLATTTEKYLPGKSGLAEFTTSSSSDAVKVTAGKDATPASLGVTVDQVARAHTIVTGAMAEWGDQPLVITNSAGEDVQVETAGRTLAQIAAAVNDAGAEVTATTVRSGTDADGKALYRMQFTAAETGAAGEFTVNTAGTVTQAGQDAKIRLYAGTDAEQVVTGGSNTFADLLPGVSLTVTKPTAEPVDVEVAADTAASSKNAKAFIDEIQKILTRIDAGTKATVEEGEDTVLGVYTGDSTVRGLRTALVNAVISPIDGRSPSEIGVSVDRYGAITFDADKFAETLANDPDTVNQFFGTIATRVNETTESYSDRFDGALTNRITSQQSATRSLALQVTQMEQRLEKRRATLELQFLNMEQAISGFNSQASFLTSQIASLTASSSSSSS